MKIDEIIVKDRIRKDPGKMMDLINNIKSNGLINPVTINTDHVLLAGFRRLQACKALGWTDIPVHMVTTEDAEQELRIEISENEVRQSFTMTERLDYARRLERIESEKAKKRMSDGGKGRQNSDNLRTDEIVAKQTGIGSRDTLRKAQTIVDNKDLIDAKDFADWDDGKLSTNKVYVQLKEKLEEEKKRSKQMEQAYQSAMDKYDAEKNKPPVVQTVEKVPDDYEDLKADFKDMQAKYEDMAERWKEEAEKNEHLIRQQNQPEEKRAEVVKSSALMFCAGVSNFLEKYGGYIWVMDCLDELDEKEKKGYMAAVNSVLAWAQQIKSNIEGEKK